MMKNPLDSDPKPEKISRYLLLARVYLPATDEFLVKRAQQIHNKDAKKKGINPANYITLHLSRGRESWAFMEYIQTKQFPLAWEELKWGCERYEAMVRLGGGNMPCFKDWPDKNNIGSNRAAFWRCMAMAAWEMTSNKE